ASARRTKMRNRCPARWLGKTLIEGMGNYLIAAGPQVGNSLIVSTTGAVAGAGADGEGVCACAGVSQVLGVDDIAGWCPVYGGFAEEFPLGRAHLRPRGHIRAVDLDSRGLVDHIALPLEPVVALGLKPGRDRTAARDDLPAADCVADPGDRGDAGGGKGGVE